MPRLSSPSTATALRRRAAGFTLVELLVVIGVIAILLSLLLPALNKARDRAKRVNCLSNIRSVAQAVHIYASTSGGVMPASVYSNGQWCYAFDAKNSTNPAAGAMGLGLLIERNILNVTAAAKLLHCEMMDTSGGGLLPAGGHSMDVPPNASPWSPFAGVSWFNTTTTHRIIYGYNYRAPSFYYTNQNAQMRLGRVKGLLIMDMPDPRFGRRYTHKDGYNYCRVDGSGGWFADRDGVIDQMAGGSLPVDGIYNPANDERIYKFVEDSGN